MDAAFHDMGHVNTLGPRAVHDDAKRFAETLTVTYRERHGVDATIARIFNTYKPRMRLDDGRVVPNFIGQGPAGSPSPCTGPGGRRAASVTWTTRSTGCAGSWRATSRGP